MILVLLVDRKIQCNRQQNKGEGLMHNRGEGKLLAYLFLKEMYSLKIRKALFSRVLEKFDGRKSRCRRSCFRTVG